MRKHFALPARGLFLGLGLVAAALVTACSGGGNSAAAPPATPGPPLGGIGPAIAFNERVNFTVIVPPPSTGAAVAAARRKHVEAVAVTNPYVSPKTASVSLQIVTVSGQSPRTLPAPLVVNVACSGGAGCSVPITNVPAAKGVDRFAVQTYSGPGGSGNLVSSGFIDVTVPSAQAASFGGTALSIGGFAASLSLALNEPAGGFIAGTPAAGTLDVNAIDPAGAIIIGSDQLAYPIALSLPTADDGVFTLNGAQSLTLQTPAQAVALAYDGAILLTGTVSASTTDENGQPVATSIPIPLQPAPTPKPSPVASNKPPISLYVYDGGSDRVFEYAGVNDVESGTPLSTTPRRIFDVAEPAALTSTVACAAQGSPFISGMAFTADGTLYAQTFCSDIATSSQFYTLVYGPATQEAVVATASPTPPPPSNYFSVSATAFGGPYGIKVDQTHNTVVLQYANASYNSANIIGVPIAATGAPTSNFGLTCLQEIGFTSAADACATNTTYNYFALGWNFGLDAAGNVYVPSQYQQGTDAFGNAIVPPGAAAEAVPGEPTVLAFPQGLNNPAPAPLAALAGFSDELGPNSGPAPYIAVEGSTLYVLAWPGTIATPGSNGATQVYAGLSGCSTTPTANATPDTPQSACTNAIGQAGYIAVFPNAIAGLTSAANAGTNLAPGPSVMLGGDVVGRFSQPAAYTGSDQFAVRDGFAYVLNATPYSGGPPEIDIYDLNTIKSGFHTDTPPVTSLVLDPTVLTAPAAIAIGPTGSAVGGQALLHRPARVHRDLKAWAARERRRLQALRDAHRR